MLISYTKFPFVHFLLKFLVLSVSKFHKLYFWSNSTPFIDVIAPCTIKFEDFKRLLYEFLGGPPFRGKLFGGTVPQNNTLFGGTVPPNNTLFGGTVPPNSTLFGGTPDFEKPYLISMKSCFG